MPALTVRFHTFNMQILDLHSQTAMQLTPESHAILLRIGHSPNTKEKLPLLRGGAAQFHVLKRGLSQYGRAKGIDCSARGGTQALRCSAETTRAVLAVGFILSCAACASLAERMRG